ncbi:hypothetical protein BGZ47_007939, partial [Haplosporangium gracile]
ALKTKLIKCKSLFQVWMGEESDTIQSAGETFGERMCFEQTLDIIHTLERGPRTIRAREVVASVEEYSLALYGVLGVDERVVFSSIAGDLGGWEEYNRFDNHGELLEKSQLDIPGFNLHNAQSCQVCEEGI